MRQSSIEKVADGGELGNYQNDIEIQAQEVLDEVQKRTIEFARYFLTHSLTPQGPLWEPEVYVVYLMLAVVSFATGVQRGIITIPSIIKQIDFLSDTMNE